MALPAQPVSERDHRRLVVLLHAFRHSPDRLSQVKLVVAGCLPAAHIVTPALPLSGRSFAHLDDVANDVVSLIDQQVQHRADQRWAEFEEIILVGHSTGSMISRKAYVIACGETSEAPFTHIDRFHPRELLPERPWASRVTRIVQLAGMNGGWSISHHMGTRRWLELSAGRIIADLAHSATGRRLVIDHIRRGAPFLTGLRLQWLAMQKQVLRKKRSPALVVQLLGTVDDLVAPDDNLDLVTGSAFLYLDVPRTGHVNVVEMNDPDAGEARRRALVLALTGTEAAISKESVVPADAAGLGRENPNITDVVFVIHGIRDTGFWTHKIARRVQAAARSHERERREFATETSTYGYFPMLSFLLPSRRREKVAWLADRYVRARSAYPNATRFSYLGHSNGTYLLTKALEENPACRFDHVVFAGSVVRTDYDWVRARNRGQVKAVLNYVATFDWIVAAFPGALERFDLQDLGGAGHSGFAQATEPQGAEFIVEKRFVTGQHSAALAESHWDEISAFICDGKVPSEMSTGAQHWFARDLGDHPSALWMVILAVVAGLALLITWIPSVPLRTLALIAFAWIVAKLLTRV